MYVPFLLRETALFPEKILTRMGVQGAQFRRLIMAEHPERWGEGGMEDIVDTLQLTPKAAKSISIQEPGSTQPFELATYRLGVDNTPVNFMPREEAAELPATKLLMRTTHPAPGVEGLTQGAASMTRIFGNMGPLTTSVTEVPVLGRGRQKATIRLTELYPDIEHPSRGVHVISSNSPELTSDIVSSQDEVTQAVRKLNDRPLDSGIILRR